MSEPRADEPEKTHLLDDIFLLLDHLQRQGDSRLQAHFSDTRQGITVGATGMVAKAPCDSYREFLTRLERIRNDGASSTLQDPQQLDDVSFLRWSRDFLAAVAAPATVETIIITREYMDARAEYALMSWCEWFWSWRSCLGPLSRNAKGHNRFKKPALWLARILIWLERGIVAVTFLTVLLSAYAMIGRTIIDKEQTALADFEKLTKAADDDHGALLQAHSARIQANQEGVGPVDGNRIEPATHQIALIFERPDYSCPVHLVNSTTALPSMQLVTDKSGTQAGAEEILLTADDGVSVDKAWGLVDKCRSVQWARMQLVSENLRLKSWDNPLVSYVPWLIGWDRKMIDRVGGVASNEFCRSVATAYQQRFVVIDPPQGCKELIDLLARDSGSLASSILDYITMSILPCLYAFIGAMAATMLWIRRRTDAALLSYTDRGRVKLNVILGFVFGAVIGLFSGYFSSKAGSAVNGLGLSALALLAGYNVPAVSEFLNDLSNRVFGSQRQSVPTT